MKRRNVFKVGVAYAIVAWVILQFIEVVSNVMNFPDWIAQAVLMLLVAGLPVALLLFFDDFEEAERISQSLIDDYPDHPFGYGALANTYRLQGRLAEALEIGLKGLEKDPELGGKMDVVEGPLADLKSEELSRKALGYVHPAVLASTGRVQEALEIWLEETPLDSMPFQDKAGFANLLILVGDEESAFQLLGPVLGEVYSPQMGILTPNMEGFGAPAYAWLLRKRGNEQAFQDTLKILRSRLEIFMETGTYPDFWYGMVRLLVLEGKYDEAIEELSGLVDSGFRAWYVDEDFILEPLFDDARFQEIVARIDAAIAIEREKAKEFLDE